MTEVIKQLTQFYAQQFHVPIDLASEEFELKTWDQSGVLLAIPSEPSVDKAMGDLTFGHDPKFADAIGGDLIIIHDVPMARVTKHALVLLFLPTNQPAWDLARKLVEQHVPRLCRNWRHTMRDALVDGITSCVVDRKKELQSTLREDAYELERLSLQLMQLSRKIEGDRQVLKLFERAPEWIKGRATRTFVDLMKLVPGTFAGFRMDDDSVIGTTHPIDIEYDGYTYHFGAFEVEVNMRQGKVFITGGTERNGYLHPHVSEEKGNVCWGNVGHLVSRLAGELDLFGLFQLVHQFLNAYNSSDPYQKIEKWNPDSEDESDDDDPYCSWCDDYGHEISDCDSCWWCDHCNQYDDHDEEDCPNRPKDEEEEEDEDAVVEATA